MDTVSVYLLSLYFELFYYTFEDRNGSIAGYKLSVFQSAIIQKRSVHFPFCCSLHDLLYVFILRLKEKN